MESKVGDLAHPPGVDQAVTGSQVAMGNNFRIVKIYHALQYIRHQRGDEHVVQVKVLIGQHVLQTAPGTISGKQDNRSMVRRGPNKVNNVLVAYLNVIYEVFKIFNKKFDLEITSRIIFSSLRMDRVMSTFFL